MPGQNLTENSAASFLSAFYVHVKNSVHVVTFDLGMWPRVKLTCLKSRFSGAKWRGESRGAICFCLAWTVDALIDDLNFDLLFWPEV